MATQLPDGVDVEDGGASGEMKGTMTNQSGLLLPLHALPTTS